MQCAMYAKSKSSTQWHNNRISLGKMKGSKKKNRNANDRSTRTSSTKSVSTSAKKSGGAAVKEKRTRLTFQDR